MTTSRLYHHDSYLVEFRARIVERSSDGCRLYLDQTAFYPSSGGQPHDTGLIVDTPVQDVIDEGDRIAHLTTSPVDAADVHCRVDWARRFDHMQQHSGQHLLSAVLVELFQIPTVSFHLGGESSTIDVAVASLVPQQVLAVEERANKVVVENRQVTVGFESTADAQGLRRASDREGPLRIVSIQGLDRTACGGTHVRATGEIGPILIRKLEKIRGNVRIEFLCGLRALRRARADFDGLSRVARVLSAPLDEAPVLVAAQLESLHTAEKSRRRLALELARLRGRELYELTTPATGGLRRVVHSQPAGSLDEELRYLAQGFTSRPKAVFLAVIEEPPSVLLAVARDAGVHAGDVLKSALSRLGGRGGGNAQIAQGSVPSKELLDTLRRDLEQIALS